MEDASSKSRDPQELLAREWTPASSDQGTSAEDSQKFSVMTFNLLSTQTCDSVSFPASPPECLAWEYRAPRLLLEITRNDPDILCVQECDTFESFFLPELEKAGYQGHFMLKANGGKDGSAIFYKRDKFSCANVDAFQIADDSQVGVIVRLQPNVIDKEHKAILVATTHLKATKTAEGEEVRKAQIEFVLDRLSAASQACSSPHVVIAAGDLNASPDGPKYTSLAYPAVLNHSLGLASAYSSDLSGDPSKSAQGEPPYTSVKVRGDQHNGGAGGYLQYTIDYIFHDPGATRVQAVLALPTLDAVGPAGLPCAQYPSDHVALMARFEVPGM